MAAATIGTLRVTLGLDSAAFTEGMGRAEKSLKSASAKFQAVGRTMATIGTGLTAAVTAPVVALGIQMGKAAIEAEEMSSAFDVSFGAMADTTRKWAETTGDAMGRSTFELQEMALGFNGLFKAGGPITQQAADMSRQFTTLAQDLASFHNVAEQDAFLALRSGLSGESEPLRRFNVYLTEGAVEAAAYSTGIAKVGSDLNEQQKIQARAALIMTATAEAQGDVIRTASGTQGQIRSLTSQWNELQVTLGQKILPLFTPIVAALNKAALAFANLSPATQTFVLAAAGIAAAVGPVLIGLGALVASVGALLPMLAPVAAAFGIVVGALSAPVWIAVAAGVAAVVGAFIAFRGQIIPVLQRFAGVVKEAVGPAVADLFKVLGSMVKDLAALFSKAMGSEIVQALVKFQMTFLSIFGEVAIRGFGVFIRLVTAGLQMVGDALSILGDLLTGDFAGAWEGAKRLVANLASNLGKAFADIAPRAIEGMRRLAEGVRGWLLGRLGDTMKWVIDRVKQVGDAFHALYIRVVGNSDIPDLVTEVGDWMAKLQQTLVDPAESATRKAGDAFEALRDRVRGIMRGLMTEREKLDLDFQDERGSLRESINGKQINPEVGAEMMRRLEARYARDSAGIDADGLTLPGIPDLSSVSDMPGVRAVNDAIASMNQAIYDSREKFADAFEYGMDAAMRGDWQGVLRSIFGDILSNSFRSAGRSIFDSMKGSGGGGSAWGKVASTIGSFFGKLPGFKTGGSFEVTGGGGVDSSLVAFRATPGEMVDIRRPGQNLSGGAKAPIHFDMRGAVMTADLLAQAQQMAMESGGMAFTSARQTVPSDMARTSRYTRGRS